MKAINKKYKETFDGIKISNDQSKKVYNSILEKTNRNKDKIDFKIRYAIFFLGVFLLGATIVYGEEVVNVFKGFLVGVSHPNKSNKEETYNAVYMEDIITIPTSTPFADSDIDRYFTVSDIEKSLNTEIIKCSKLSKEKFKLSNIRYNADKVSRVLFVSDNMSANENKEIITFSFALNTQYSTEEERDTPIFYLPTLHELKTYHIDSLDVDAFIYDYGLIGEEPDWAKDVVPIEANATFTYKGITYNIKIKKTNYNIEDFYEYLDSFSY